MIVGLGNPGSQYENTRHNIGFTFVDELARIHGGQFKLEKKFKAYVGKVPIDGREIILLKPDTFMNLSGDAVQKACHFYKFKPENLLIVHDELDLPVGEGKWKFDGGHGGHNGLRDITAKLASAAFYRLRLGIGHPGQAHLVSHYVLSKPQKEEAIAYDACISAALHSLSYLLEGDLLRAMNAFN
ncbi:MAG: aminoacyl-tRNA hydrolase [Gammaproteobacteria bacterium CG11_big_fil_rev_8_21_14_0_20_46_22]|nr:MAG: aminoacyl-tRNA hydrolase [Gammaproteobacteria bacterium CG12_big_fil_rev_8_21_14_0_65_46_12]PIR10742.1 MAG: aminoacyl-tRNA hydrolase [Gammaproteobacteria bacterium CG11_big_fil_rev_8_21_14_0_20_46_22]